jgi:tRNA-binding EMAP/Myf-like protein
LRKLASIKTISNIIPIEGRDRIELAIIDGWSVIVKKDEFKVGDICIYCEIDSVMPELPEFEFLRSKKFRIKTMKMAGVISQGIVFHPNSLGYNIIGWDGHSDFLLVNDKGNIKANIGTDVTDIIGVKQYESTRDIENEDAIKSANKTKYPKWLMRCKVFRQWVYKRDHREGKGFPTFISKTDETRIQNVPWILNNNNENWIITEKLDGQSGTFVLIKHKSKIPFIKEKIEYTVCSRNLRLFNKDNSSYWKVSDRYDIENKLRKMIGTREWIAIQGECLASNVQANKYKVSEPDLYVFNVIYPTGRLGTLEAQGICEFNGLKFVPVLDICCLPSTVNEMLNYAHGESKLGNTLREGVVCRSGDGKQSFKAVDPLFLLKYDE